jgi:hypothetical protein
MHSYAAASLAKTKHAAEAAEEIKRALASIRTGPTY